MQSENEPIRIFAALLRKTSARQPGRWQNPAKPWSDASSKDLKSSLTTMWT